MMQIRLNLLLVFSLMIEDVKLNEFIDALSSMVGYWSYMSSHDVKSSMVVDCTFFWFLLMVYTCLSSSNIFPILQKLPN